MNIVDYHALAIRFFRHYKTTLIGAAQLAIEALVVAGDWTSMPAQEIGYRLGKAFIIFVVLGLAKDNARPDFTQGRTP